MWLPWIGLLHNLSILLWAVKIRIQVKKLRVNRPQGVNCPCLRTDPYWECVDAGYPFLFQGIPNLEGKQWLEFKNRMSAPQAFDSSVLAYVCWPALSFFLDTHFPSFKRPSSEQLLLVRVEGSAATPLGTSLSLPVLYFFAACDLLLKPSLLPECW